MEKNVGTIDRIIRVIIGIALIGAGYFYGIWWLYLIALLPIATAAMGYCPLYQMLKISTNK